MNMMISCKQTEQLRNAGLIHPKHHVLLFLLVLLKALTGGIIFMYGLCVIVNAILHNRDPELAIDHLIARLERSRIRWIFGRHYTVDVEAVAAKLTEEARQHMEKKAS